MKQIGILGGSFNPPHLGHTAIAHYVLAQGNVEQVWVLPCWQHPFEKELAPFEDRLAMCQLAFADQKNVEVLDLERTLGGVSFTLRTVQTLQKKFPDSSFSLIVGEDAYQERNLWHGIKELEKLVQWICIPRGKNSPIPDVSAKEIRHILAEGKSATLALAPTILQYIRQHHLYSIKN